jgi:hypothetical protein
MTTPPLATIATTTTKTPGTKETQSQEKFVAFNIKQ